MTFVDGRVASGVTVFGMQGGRGVMREAGLQAIMPLACGRVGKLGVFAKGGGSDKLQIEITEDPIFASEVEGMADGRAVQMLRKCDRETAPQSHTWNPRECGGGCQHAQSDRPAQDGGYYTTVISPARPQET